MEASKADLEWSARIDQALEEYPEMREYLDAIRGNIEALTARLAAIRELHILYTDIRELQWCYHCETPWPCPTRRTLDGD